MCHDYVFICCKSEVKVRILSLYLFSDYYSLFLSLTTLSVLQTAVFVDLKVSVSLHPEVQKCLSKIFITPENQAEYGDVLKELVGKL